MTVLVVGLSHRSAPVDVLEAHHHRGGRRPQAVGTMLGGEHVSEAVLVSTCNRVEVYAAVDALPRRPRRRLRGPGPARRHRARGTRRPHLYVHYEARPSQHVFRVAAGLDSMVVGEAQILGQLA